MKILKWLPDIIRVFILCLVIAGIVKIMHFLNDQIGDNIPSQDYQTVFVKDTNHIKQPDTKVKWLEKIKQVEMKPETVKVVIYDYKTPDELVNYIKAYDGKIVIRTQECGDIFGKELIYPYYKYFQFVPPNSMIYYKDYWDWERLSISITYNLKQETEIKLYTSLQFNPWHLKIQPYVSSKSTGIEIRKRLW